MFTYKVDMAKIPGIYYKWAHYTLFSTFLYYLKDIIIKKILRKDKSAKSNERAK